MSARKVEQDTAVRHPRETPDLFGHRDAETALLNAYRSGRIPHAWLIGGAQGIGKATLAYRMARFVLTHPNPLSSSVQRAETLAVDPADPVARQVTNGAHGGLLVLERSLNDRGVMRTVITVDETRETISFFGSTAAVDGWRVCIVDTVDELNPNAANALLKILEEPPQRSLFLLVSHSPARALPTILSRCRKLPLRPLATEDVIRAAAQAANMMADDPALAEAAEAAEGSVSRAVTLLGGDALKLQQRTAALLAPCRMSTRANCTRSVTRSAAATAWPLRPSSTASIAGSAKSCARITPTPTCRALHGWRRYGKRSSAPRAIRNRTIWNENRWFSRCSGCSRKPRGDAPFDIIRTI